MSTRPELDSFKCHASVEAALEPLSIVDGHLSIPTETCIFTLLSECYTKIRDIFGLNDPENVLGQPDALDSMLKVTFDTFHRSFVTEKSTHVLADLDDHEKSSLYLQAVAGMVLIFQRLEAAGPELSQRLFSRELQLFAESDQRESVLETIDTTDIINSCFAKRAVVDFISGVIEGRKKEQKTEDQSVNAAWGKNLGVPWGFTVMALN